MDGDTFYTIAALGLLIVFPAGILLAPRKSR
jgi:hypothetical protein